MKRRNIVKRLIASVATFAIAVTMLAPMTVEAAPSYSKKQVVYLRSKGGSGSTSVSIGNIAKGQKIVGATSSNKAVAKPSGYYNWTGNYKDFDNSEYNYDNADGHVDVTLYKTGKATISTKIGKSTKSYKTYKTELTVKAYDNPIKKFTITGVNSGKDLSKKFAKQAWQWGTLSKSAKSAKIQVSADTSDGWKIQSIEYSTYSNSDGSHSSRYLNYPKGKSSVSMSVGTISYKTGADIYVRFVNSKTGGTMSCSYYIEPNN